MKFLYHLGIGGTCTNSLYKILICPFSFTYINKNVLSKSFVSTDSTIAARKNLRFSKIGCKGTTFFSIVQIISIISDKFGDISIKRK